MSLTVIAVIGIVLGFLLLVIGSCVEMGDTSRPRMKERDKMKGSLKAKRPQAYKSVHKKAA